MYKYFIFCLLCFLGACGEQNNNPATQQYMTAYVNGELWQATTFRAAIRNGVLTIAGQTATQEKIQIILVGTTPSEYQFSNITESRATYQPGMVAPADLYSTKENINAGGRASISYIDLTSKLVSGSFEFVSYQVGGVNVRTISRGMFWNVPIGE
jgi:hypothetical protein